jgi:CheY-like chemotaxis protein
MAHGFAEQSGGRLAIVSAPGHGTTVALLLPAATDDATAEGAGPVPEPVGREPPAEGSGLSLLLVDDAAAEARATLGGELHAAGFEVARADHAGAALARLGGPERFDAVVIDLAAPGGGDAALASELPRRHPGLPILRITANDAAPAAPEGGTAPSAALPGPAAPQAVVRAVLGLVRGRRGAPPPASAAAAIA